MGTFCKPGWQSKQSPKRLKNRSQNNPALWGGIMRASIFCPLTHNLLAVEGVILVWLAPP